MSSSTNQYFSAICVNILSLGAGASISWTSPYMPLLQSIQSPFKEPISASQASWIGSLLAIGALIGSFFFGWLSEKFGRFWSLISAAIPQILWWVIVIHSSTEELLFIGRFSAGISIGGCFTLVPLYIAEISQDKIRGSLGFFFMLSSNIGILLMYLAGNVLDYYTTPKVMLLLPASFLILFSLCPETPIYLVRKGRLNDAERSLTFLRSFKARDTFSSEVVNTELQKMIRKVNDDALKIRRSNLNAMRRLNTGEKGFGLNCFNKDLPLSGSTPIRKGIIIGVALIAVNQLSGLFTFLSYTGDIFKEAGSEFDPNTSAVIVGTLLFVGSLVSSFIVDKFPRRFLYCLTTVAFIIGLNAIGIYSYSKTLTDVSRFKFVPIASLSLIIFSASAGRLPLTFIMMTEIMPQSIRSFGVTVCTIVNWTLAFILLRFFTTIIETLQFHLCMFAFSGVAILGIIFVIIFVPETKNRSFDEIENSLRNRREKHTKPENLELKNSETDKL